ncbi:NAD(+)/NADH kinase, partial [Candidatus Peregrinibacteria bacterium]|nr:NAD(+)/NADH kinase [Candidatus Peregrinibacteria bacterium]
MVKLQSLVHFSEVPSQDMANKELKHIGIITKSNVLANKDIVEKTVKALLKYEREVMFDEHSAKIFNKKKGYRRNEILEKSDMVVVLGGDGTLLKTARCVGYHPVLIFGINLGRVGFLSEIPPADIEKALKRIFVEKRFHIEKRFILRVTVYRKGKKIKTFLALNEAVINQGAFARLIDLRTEINQRKVAHFRADGLIISTPTGSTGHALSAGGPIVHHDIEGIILTPICPAELANRAIIIPNDRQIKIIIETKRREEKVDLGLTLDGQEMFPLHYGDEIKVRKSGREISFIRLS